MMFHHLARLLSQLCPFPIRDQPEPKSKSTHPASRTDAPSPPCRQLISELLFTPKSEMFSFFILLHVCSFRYVKPLETRDFIGFVGYGHGRSVGYLIRPQPSSSLVVARVLYLLCLTEFLRDVSFRRQSVRRSSASARSPLLLWRFPLPSRRRRRRRRNDSETRHDTTRRTKEEEALMEEQK